MTSPYLLRPLRTLDNVLLEREKEAMDGIYDLLKRSDRVTRLEVLRTSNNGALHTIRVSQGKDGLMLNRADLERIVRLINSELVYCNGEFHLTEYAEP